MNAVTTPQNATAEGEAKTVRARQFGRVYDHTALTVAINAAFNKDFTSTIEAAKVPQAVRDSLALQAIADYAVTEAMDAMKDPANVADPQGAAIAAYEAAVDELYTGKIDFRSGVGLGGMRSAIGALGQALFELGKTFVKDQFGNKLEFNDLHSARAAVKSLYLSTEPKGPFHPKLDDAGNPVLKDGKPQMVATNKDSPLTGRMIFNLLQQVPEVKAKLAEIRPIKESAVSMVEMG